MVFLLDASASITEDRFQNQMLGFVAGMLDYMAVGSPGASRVGLATFSRLGGADFHLQLDNGLDRRALRDAVLSVPYAGGLTFVRTALIEARVHFAEHRRDDVSARPVLITILDGAFTAGVFEGNGSTFVDYRSFLAEANALRAAQIHSYSVLLPLIGEVYDPFTREQLSPQQRTKSALILSTDPNIRTRRYYFEHGSSNSSSLVDLVPAVSDRVCVHAHDVGAVDECIGAGGAGGAGRGLRVDNPRVKPDR